MPWTSVNDLPSEIRETLPSGAQELFLKSFNIAWKGACKDQGNQQETCAFQQAWGAVKKLYKKEGNTWVSAASIHPYRTRTLYHFIGKKPLYHYRPPY